ncbi:MAG: TetR family transcriptional regulator C-terminal domain-containing protein, partial [Oscillospiraceae bacterium]|nr:TetR family transcriptional regulator C-terminal domain-containing protein [Oscillospiraceae bacterium]
IVMSALSNSEQYLVKIRKQMYGNTDKNIDYALAFQTGGFISILIKWLSNGTEKTPDEMAEIVVDITGQKYL